MAKAKLKPLELIEDAETGDRFVVYARSDGYEFQLRFKGDEPWATQDQVAQLFGVSRSMVTRHIKNLLDGGEIEEKGTCSYFEHVGTTGQAYRTNIYNLDVILAVGYRVRATKQAIIFRRWANQILKQYLLKGFVIDVPRLEQPDDRPDFFEELLAKVRHIRSSEHRMWTRVLELASFCTDYHALNKIDKKNFFATVLNAMHWAVHQQTAAELVYSNVDASKLNAGVVSFKGDIPTAKEAAVAKNNLGEQPINALNILTSAMLEFFESQAEQQRPTTLAQFLSKLRDFIKLDGRPLIPDGYLGEVTMPAAKKKAATEIAIYKERVRIEKENAGEIAVTELLSKARKIVSEKRTKRTSTSKRE